MIEQTRWVIFAEVMYALITLGVCLRIIYDTRSVSKTLAYLLLVFFVPVLGIAFYFSFGINYRVRKIYTKKLKIEDKLQESFIETVKHSTYDLFRSKNSAVEQYSLLISQNFNPDSGEVKPVFCSNEVDIMVNGEAFFPVLLEKLESAKHHIHMEYYIYANDSIGNKIKDILIRKAQEGVKVRFIYDDFGSSGIRRAFVREMREAGVEAYPFYKVRLIVLANRLNYRNHRKIVVIDGHTSFTGGINVSDKYINNESSDLYWRDTHMMIEGRASYGLQQIFLSDWNFCSEQNMEVGRELFPVIEDLGSVPVQVISSGPDYERPAILNSILRAIYLSKEEVLLTTPYYIPEASLQETLILAALSGVKVKLLVPKKGDSKIVNMVAHSFYEELLQAGVEIYRYNKGFIHAKTFVCDRKLASIGTANLDQRSFDLNFEVATLIYDETKGQDLANIFYEDLKDAEELTLERWLKRPRLRKFGERFMRLLSPFM